MILWAAELGKCYSNVYGKISFAPLNILSSVPSMYKFVEFINSSNFEPLRNLAIYTYKAFKVGDGELLHMTTVCSFTLIILMYLNA